MEGCWRLESGLERQLCLKKSGTRDHRPRQSPCSILRRYAEAKRDRDRKLTTMAGTTDFDWRGSYLIADTMTEANKVQLSYPVLSAVDCAPSVCPLHP